MLGMGDRAVIERVEFDEDADAVVAHVRPKRPGKRRCGRCAARSPGYDATAPATPGRSMTWRRGWLCTRPRRRSWSCSGWRGPQSVDAHVVAAAAEAGGGVVLTGDADDLTRLAASYPNVHVASF